MGAIIRAWVQWLWISKFCNVAIINDPVLPEPDFACAMVSLKQVIGGIAKLCIGVGFSNPYLKMPLKISSFIFNSSQLSIIFSWLSLISFSIIFIFEFDSISDL